MFSGTRIQFSNELLNYIGEGLDDASDIGIQDLSELEDETPIGDETITNDPESIIKANQYTKEGPMMESPSIISQSNSTEYQES